MDGVKDQIGRRFTMRKNMMAATALASSLVLAAALTANAAPAFNLKSAQGTSTGTIELIKSGGDGGGGGGRGGGGDGGGGHMSAGGGDGGGPGGGGASIKGGGDGGGGGGGHARGGDGGRLALKGGDFDGGGPKGASRRGGDHDGKSSDRHAGGGDWKGDWKGGGKHHHGKNFRRFGPDIFVYGGGGYGYNDCGWLRRQAIITGSPYWWRRYQDCLYYD